MLYDDRQKILEICKKNGDHTLMSFVRETETDRLVDMFIQNGDGNDLLEYFEKAYPYKFQEESPEERADGENAYWKRKQEQERRAGIL